MPSPRRLVLLGALAALPLAPAALHAQASRPVAKAPATGAGADSLAFPRQFVKWVLASQGDSAFAHAGSQLQQTMGSADGVNQMATRIKTRFGELQGTEAETQFADGALKVYIAAMRFPQAPELAAWVVAYDPATKMVERAGFSPLSRVKAQYPQAKLP